MAKFFYPLLFIAVLICQAVGQTVYVPANHPVYEFLERMETHGLLTGVLNGTRPMTRQDIAGYLQELSSIPQALNRLEQKQWHDLVSKFREELPGLYQQDKARIHAVTGHTWIGPWLPDLVYNNGRNFYAHQQPDFKVYLDPVIQRTALLATADTLSKTEKVYENGNGLMMWGTLGNNLGFYAHVRDTKEWGTRPYPGDVNVTAPGVGFVAGGHDHIYHDETRAYLVYNKAFLTLQYGKDENQWGPGHRGQLLLGDAATSYDLFKIQVTLKNIKYTSMVALLQNYTPGFFYGDHQQKYMAAHRLEFAPVPRLQIGLHESVIYAGRGFEPAYFNPVMFFRSAEHYLGDRDNAALGLDVEWFPVNQVMLYGELFIDDLTTGKLGSGFYGNKYAWLAGLYHTDPLGLANSSLRLEYTRIRPFTYTHKYDITSYRHYITGMGHPLGSNADEWYLEWSWMPLFRAKLDLYMVYQRHGANTQDLNAGGSLYLPHDPGDSIDAPFLDGIRESNRRAGISFRYEIIHELYVTLRYCYGQGDSDWQPGKNWPGDRSEFWFALGLN